MFDLFNELIAINNEEKVNLLYSRSNYGTDKKHMFDKKNEEYKYECCYSITLKDGIKFFYSSTNTNGHFNIPKIIWSNGLGTYPIIDDTGKYGLTQFSYGIIDKKENFEKIKKALNSHKFLNLFKYCKFTNNKYDHKVIRTFKKNFYENFQEDNEIENDNTSISSKSTTKSSKSTKSLTNEDAVLCGASLKKKGETCKNKANSECNGRCKRHFVKVI